ncbi:transmembrane protein 42 [Caerostris extrusa]|uniref:Transmembrane protein 42 n=1 Tax=Caerostris extrusa TaxID=172846 RepID=A0AAV4Q777_CAEEX|nr:transmembrane protein 42 [Caerostris extrusa]
MQMKGITFSLLSGFLAATASLCGKLSMAAEKTLMLCEMFLENLPAANARKNNFTYSPVCQNILLFTRVGFLFAMVISNILMWTIYSKALRLTTTVLEAAITNLAANFLFTAAYGQVFFGESLGFLWWMGTALCIIGLTIMQKEDAKMPTVMKAKKN